MRGLQCGRVMPPPVRAAAEQSYQAFLRQHRRHVRLRLANRNNARERGFALFSGFDKHSYVERDGRLGGPCLLVLYYYDFDREDLLARLLSLGGDVTVLADEKTRKPPASAKNSCAATKRRCLTMPRTSKIWTRPKPRRLPQRKHKRRKTLRKNKPAARSKTCGRFCYVLLKIEK
ncbi:hypothetical protein [uncultured Selenomonas sp.]|uniref:hypothetical protein n=1 Tax=uncultured Selenomonas sp. TaxID=159275 RepID=UPI0025D54187|nr:hypothetical protein [uncultured Selenomonas sp.]